MISSTQQPAATQPTATYSTIQLNDCHQPTWQLPPQLEARIISNEPVSAHCSSTMPEQRLICATEYDFNCG